MKTSTKRSPSAYALVDEYKQLSPEVPFYHEDWTVPLEKTITKLHRHNCLEVGFCHSGAGVFVVGDRVYPFSPGSACILFSGEFHLASSIHPSGSPWKFVYIHESLLPALCQSSSTLPRILTSPDYGQAIDSIKSITKETSRPDAHSPTIIRGCLMTLFGWLARKLDGDTSQGISPHPSASQSSDDIRRIAPAIAYISSHYSEDISLQQLSDLCNVSQSHLRRMFRDTIGRSPQNYVEEFRLQVAETMLRTTSLPILEICQQAGYQSTSNFNRQFKAKTGMSPRQWRITQQP